MQRLAKELGPAAAIVCISNDHGFAPALRYAAEQGCTTVAVMKFDGHWRLFEAARRGLVWSDGWEPSARQAAEEAAWARRAGLPLLQQPTRGGVVQAWRAGKGYWSLEHQ